MEGETKRYRALSRKLENFCNGILDTADDAWTPGLIQTRQEFLDGYWGDFQQGYDSLVNEEIEEEEKEHADEMYEQAEDVYIRAKSLLRDLDLRMKLSSKQNESMESMVSSNRKSTSFRLPRISIPEFSGRREDWEPFRDLFKALIHEDPSLTDVERIYYLKSHVRGEARKALDSLQNVGSNYLTAWGLLEARYEHRRLLINDHLMALRNLKPLKEESSTGLQGLLDKLERHRDQLKTLGCPIEQWDEWFLFFAGTSMDIQTRRSWEDEIEKMEKAEVQNDVTKVKFSTLTSFLRQRCRTLSSVEGSRSFRTSESTTSRPNRSSENTNSRSFKSSQYSTSRNSISHSRGLQSFATQTSLNSCKVCNQYHYIGHCEKFKNLSLQERRDFVNRERLCFNCLRNGHALKFCQSNSVCQQCKGTHHTLLHDSNRKRERSIKEDGFKAIDSTSFKRRKIESAKDNTSTDT